MRPEFLQSMCLFCLACHKLAPSCCSTAEAPYFTEADHQEIILHVNAS